MRLSILDQAPITRGNKATDALKKAEELAILGDELGYHRMWMAEHHGTNDFASSAPEVTAAHLAAKTKKMRIGTGGVMLMHYSPLKLAEVFKTLSAFSPGRIDFGVGRAPGGDNYSMYALSEGRQPMVNNMYEKFDTALQLRPGAGGEPVGHGALIDEMVAELKKNDGKTAAVVLTIVRSKQFRMIRGSGYEE